MSSAPEDRFTTMRTSIATVRSRQGMSWMLGALLGTLETPATREIRRRIFTTESTILFAELLIHGCC